MRANAKRERHNRYKDRNGEAKKKKRKKERNGEGAYFWGGLPQ